MNNVMVTLLFPGRHHMLTKYQHSYLKNLIEKGVNGDKVDKLIFAVTSANHANTRRNPIPLYLRVLAIEKFSRDLSCEVKIYPIFDVDKTDKFAEYIINQIFYYGNEKLTPKDTIIVCSTPSVIKLFKKFGFRNLPVELIDEKNGKYKTFRPFEIIDILVNSGNDWKNDKKWKEYASEATQNVYFEYNLGDLIIELFNDSLLNEDADITNTRNYKSYAKSMDSNIEFKFNDIKPFIVEGKIVDAGCGTGALVYLLSKEFKESDVIGIEVTRKFYEWCKLQEYPSPFVYFYRRNILNQNFKENTINTFIYSSVLHEIYSYINEKELINLLKNTYKQLTKNGRIIIRDVLGPDKGDSEILMELNEKNGSVHGDVKNLSTYSRFLRFSKDFKPRKIKFKPVKMNGKNLINLKLRDAYEFISKMNYVENWQSEMHEEFGFWDFNDWRKVLEKAGFKIVPGSREFKSDYIIKNHYDGKVILYKPKGKELIRIDYPSTNMILAGEKII